MSDNNQEVNKSNGKQSIKFEKLLRDFAVFSIILFIYVTFFSKQHNHVPEYAEKTIGKQYVTHKKLHQLQNTFLQIHTEEADASIRDVRSVTAADTVEDNASFFNADKKHLDRIWTEVFVNNVRLENISWSLMSADEAVHIYKGVSGDITIIQKYNVENCIVSVKTVVHNAGEDANVQVVFCTSVDARQSVQSGFKTDIESGFSTSKLDLGTIEKNVQHIKTDYAGIIKKYWLICMRAEKTDTSAKSDHNISMFKVGDQIMLVNQAKVVAVPHNTYAESSVEYYLGARETKTLELHAKRFGINLVSNIDYGWLSWINALIRIFIEWLISLFGRADVALLAFILMMRILLLYPYIIAEKHARMIALLETKVKKIKADYTSEVIATEKIQALYKLHGINEYIAKFPMFAQMLWLIPLNIMSQLFSFRGAPFFGMIKDMSALDHTSWTNLFGLLPWAAYNIRFINFGVWMVIFAGTYLISEDISKMDRFFIVIMLLSTILIYKNFPVIFVLFWCIVNIIGAVQIRCFKWFIHPKISV